MGSIRAHAPSDPAKRLKIVLLSSRDKPRAAEEAARLLPLVAQYADAQSRDLADDLSRLEFDLGVVLGGDGSMLRAAHQMGRQQRPLLGVNLGNLGFLADLSPEEFLAKLSHVCSPPVKTTSHLMYECRVVRNGRTVHEQLGLNEVAVLAGPPFAILDVDLYVDSELVTTYSCDGLIVSTPIGSTAHSLSAGGPILRQDLQAFVISPVSPHTLTNRPVVDSADRVFEMAIARPHEGTSVVADGRVVCRVEPGDRVRVERSAAQFQLVALTGHGYYRTLREKLGWGGRLKASS